MDTTIFLRPKERALFERLPEALRANWKVAEETQQFQDTAHRQQLRIQFMRLQDQSLRTLQENCRNAKSEEEMKKIIEEIDLSDIDERDLFQILFAMGPEVMSKLIVDAIGTAETEKHVEAVAAFSEMRHISLESLITSFSAL